MPKKLLASILVVVALGFGVGAAVLSFTSGAAAQSGPAPTAEVDGRVVTVTWDAVVGSGGYRVGWADYQALLDAQRTGIPWTERFAYTDLRSSVTEHVLPGMNFSTQYAVVVGSRGSAGMEWLPWIFATTADPPCVCGAGGPPLPPSPPLGSAP